MKRFAQTCALTASLLAGLPLRAATLTYDSGETETEAIFNSLAEGDRLEMLNAGTKVTSICTTDDLVTKNDVSILIDGGYLEKVIAGRGAAAGLCSTLGVTGLRLDIRNGGTYCAVSQDTTRPGLFRFGGTGSQICVDGGSLLLGEITEYAWGSGFGNARDCTIALTNAAMNAFVFKFGLQKKPATGCRLLVHNSTFDMVVPSLTPQYTARRYFQWLEGCSVSNEMIVSGCSAAKGFSTFEMNGKWDRLRIQDEAVCTMPIGMGGFSNVVEMAGGTCSASKCTIGGQGNRLALSGGSLLTGASGVLTVTGRGNLVRQTGGTYAGKGGVSLGGADNRYEYVAGEMKQALTLTGTNVCYAIGANLDGGRVVFADAAVDCRCELDACWTNTASVSGVSLGGSNSVFVLKAGSEYRTPGNNNLISFFNRANSRLVISNATYTIDGRICVGNGNVDSFNWTNCPNAAIEFRGTNPLMRCVSTPNYKAWVIGTEDGLPLKDPVHFKFVLPKAGYAAAPMQNQVSNRGARLFGNAVFEIDAGEFEGFGRVPLFYTAGGWREMTMSEAIVDQLNERAILPSGWKLVWDGANTIYARRSGGMVLSIK